MVLNNSLEAIRPSISCETSDQTSNASKTSFTSKSNDAEGSSTSKKLELPDSTLEVLRVHSQTTDNIEFSNHTTFSSDRSKSLENDIEIRLSDVTEGKSETSLTKITIKPDDENPKKPFAVETPAEDQCQEGRKKSLVYKKPSETFAKLHRENSTCSSGGSGTNRSPGPSETTTKPKPTGKHHLKPGIPKSKLPIKMIQKEKPGEGSVHSKMKSNLSKSNKPKKDGKAEVKAKHAIQENFSMLVPFHENELKNIANVWVNTTYCSLTLRKNLINLLYQMFPQINRAQFETEDDRLFKCICHVKTYTKSEIESLTQFIKLLIKSQEKTKEDYLYAVTNKQIAESYNYDWKALSRKITKLGEDTKQLKMLTPELEKKNDDIEASAKEKIRKMEISLSKREEEIKKLQNQLNVLKQRENSYKGNVLVKVEDYKDIKSVSLQYVQKEFQDLKAKYMTQNNMFEKKVKDLEVLLEEKKTTLEKEKELKKQLQVILGQLQAQQKHLYHVMGKDQVDYFMGRSICGKHKKRETLWMTAVRLVLKGFLLQMKKLERDRNKMLLELNSNDVENFTTLATSIVQKENFIKSVKHQMNYFSKNLTSKANI